MLFTKGNKTAVTEVKHVLNAFSKASGLRVSDHKSSVFLSGVSTEEEEAIRGILQMSMGEFPIRYLGIPLHGRTLHCAELQALIQKLTARI